MNPNYNKPIDEALLDPSLRLNKIVGSTEQMKVNPQVPLLRYYRSLLEIEKMAKEYIKDMKLERAFILLYRFSWLAVSELKTHPDYPNHDSEEKQQVLNLLPHNMELAEKIKNEIRNVYQLQSDYYRFEEEQRKLRISNFDLWMNTRAEATAQSAKLLQIAELATQRIGMTMGRVLPIQPQPDKMHAQNSPPRKRETSDSPEKPLQNFQNSEIFDPQVSTADISYGDVLPPKRPAVVQSPPMLPGTSAASAFRPIEKLQPSESKNAPSHQFSFAAEYPSLLSKKSNAPPEVCRDMKPSTLNPGLLGKTMAVPTDLVEKFLAACAHNTEKNIETCGVLGGSLIKDKIIITHVVMPKQTGSANGCSSDDDVELATVLSSQNLLSVGWIHTHPSQTAFLSSVDLHTHHGYQQMMPEAIAIVCAPSHNEVGTFTLTKGGMSTIGQCELQGFHPHTESVGELFTSAGHVHFTANVSAQIVDLRY